MAESSESQQKKGGPGRPFKPGVSPNPGGISKDTANSVRRCRELAASYATEALEGLVELMRTSSNEKVRREAMDSILDRAGVGKHVAITGEDGGPLKADLGLLELLTKLK